MTGEFPAQMVSITENFSTGWRHHAECEQACPTTGEDIAIEIKLRSIIQLMNGSAYDYRTGREVVDGDIICDKREELVLIQNIFLMKYVVFL